MQTLVDSFKLRLPHYTGTMNSLTDAYDLELHLKPGTSLRLLKYLIARKQVIVNMSEKIKFTKSVQSIVCEIAQPQRQSRLA